MNNETPSKTGRSSFAVPVMTRVDIDPLSSLTTTPTTPIKQTTRTASVSTNLRSSPEKDGKEQWNSTKAPSISPESTAIESKQVGTDWDNRSDEVKQSFSLCEAALSSVAPVYEQNALRQELFRLFRGPLPKPKALAYNPSAVTQDMSGLKELSDNGCWRAVINLSYVLSKQEIDICPREMLVIHSYHILAQLKLRNYVKARSIFEEIGDFTKYKYELYEERFPGKKGSFVPLNICLLHSELLFNEDKHMNAIKPLYTLLGRIRTQMKLPIEEQDSLDSNETWNKMLHIVINKLVEYLVKKQMYTCAIILLKELLSQCEDSKFKTFTVLSQLARVNMSLGDMNAARSYVNMSEKIELTEKTTQVEIMISTNKALLYMAKQQYIEAYTILSELLSNHEECKSNPIVLNNMALSALYMNRVIECVEKLEQIISQDPIKYINQAILLNLDAVYRLCSTKHQAKRMMLEALGFLYGSDDFNLPVVSDIHMKSR